MGNRRLYEIKRYHTLGTSESEALEALKVTALNLFHPTTSPPFPKNRFFHIATLSPGEGESKGEGIYRGNFKYLWLRFMIRGL
jgi:hypothetical protein